MQFDSPTSRNDFLGAHYEDVMQVVLDFSKSTRRFPLCDVGVWTSEYVWWLMDHPNGHRVLDRYDPKRSLRAYLRQSFRWWYSDRAKSDGYATQRADVEVELVAEYVASPTPVEAAEQHGLPPEVIAQMQALQADLLDQLMAAVGRVLDGFHQLVFFYISGDRGNQAIAEILGVNALRVAEARSAINRLLGRLRINDLLVRDFYLAACRGLLQGGRWEDIQYDLSVVGVGRQGRLDGALVQKKIVRPTRVRGNYHYDLREGEICSHEAVQILYEFCGHHRNPHDRLKKWANQGRLLIRRTNGETDSRARIYYDRQSIYRLLRELQTKRELREIERLRDRHEQLAADPLLGLVMEAEDDDEMVEQIGQPTVEKFNDDTTQ